MRAIISDGGVCTTKDDLDNLMSVGNAESLRNQIRYRKMFNKEKHLKVSSCTKEELYNQLLSQIEEDEIESETLSNSKSKRTKVVSDSDDTEKF